MLPLRRAVSNRQEEANTLSAIGRVYESLDEKQQAIASYKQALALRRAEKDQFRQALSLNSIGSVYDDLGESERT